MPKLRQVNAEDIKSLEQAQDWLRECDIRDSIRRAGAKKTLAKFDSLMKSLDGALRHARRCESDVTR